MSIARGYRLREWKHIFGDRCAAADVGVHANANKLMDWAHCPHHRPFSHDYVSPKRGGIGQNHPISDYTIMRDVSVGHDERVIADAGHSSAFWRAAVDGDKFTNDVVLTYSQMGRLAGVSNILRSETNGRKGEEVIVGADRGGPFHHYVRREFAVFADFYIWPDDAVGPDFT